MSEDKLNETPQPAPLVEVRRGAVVESRHRGHVAAVDGDGRLVASLGEPETVTFMRSSAKLHQVIPLITSGAAERFEFTDREIAIACGSHSGQDVHAETVARVLQKIGLDETALRCGTHEPFDAQTARELTERGEQPGPLRNNCSGKHAAMLALALHLGAPTESYFQLEHPVQQVALKTISRFADVPAENIPLGVDGCGVPVFALPVRAMALMFARLISPPEDFDEETRAACARIVRAVTSHPELVGGTRERFDTGLMRAAGGRLVSKVGAEGVYTAGILPCEEWPRGLGVAFKIEDGEDRRARPTVAVETLRQLGVLHDGMLEAAAPYASFPVLNRRGETVGVVRPAFTLKIHL